MNKKNKKQTLARLALEYADPKPALHYNSPFELLIAVILSAQCTDVRVNLVTDTLFASYNTPQAIVSLGAQGLEEKIRSCGLAPSKAKNIIATCKILIDEMDCVVPADLAILQSLPGVGRKTANVVASVAFGIPAIAVDTHVFRVSNKIGLVKASNVLDTEKQLMALIPQKDWSVTHHRLIYHGRKCCTARKPNCAQCVLQDLCDQNEGE